MFDSIFLFPFIGLLLLAPLCAIMGQQIINFRMAYFSDAISHSVFTGVALGFLLGVSPQITIVVFALLMALLINRLQQKSSLSLDTVVGCVQALVIAFGLTVISARNSLTQTLPQFLFGDILTFTAVDVTPLIGLTILVVGFQFYYGNRLLALSLHEELALAHQSAKRSHRLINDLLIALCVAYGVRAVGLFLITALMVLPAASARNLARNQAQFIGWSLLIVTSSIILGFAAALKFNSSVAAAIILVAGVWYVISSLTYTSRLSSFLIILCLSGLSSTQALAGSVSAKEILDRIDDLWRGQSSKSVFSMEIQTAHTKRHLKLRNYSLGKDYSLVSIELPEKERGTATLKVDNDIWNYLPKTDRVIKLPPSMLLSQWMGSHFTNDDLVKESRMADDYDYTITFDGTRDSQQIYELTLIPKARVAVVWGKIVVEVRKVDLMPLKQHYYDEKQKLARESHFADFRTMDGKLIPTKMTIMPKDKANEYTTVVTESIDFDVNLQKSFFSIKELKRP